MMQDFSFFKIVLIQLTNSIPNPNFRRICNKSSDQQNQMFFLISIVTKKPSSASAFAISKISEITISLSLINPLLTSRLIRRN